MESPSVEDISRDLWRRWSEQDYTACRTLVAAPLAAARQQIESGDKQGGDKCIDELAALLLPLKPSFAQKPADLSEEAIAFRSLRAEILSQAAQRNLELLIFIKADAVGTEAEGDAWAKSIMHSIALQSEVVGVSRERLWETTVLVYWSVARVLSAREIDETVLADLVGHLNNTGARLCWQDSPSITKTMLHRERQNLQDMLVDHALRLAQAGKLTMPEKLIGADSDGRMLSALAGETAKYGARHANGAALLYFLYSLGNISRAQFVDCLLEHDICCLMPMSGHILIASGEIARTGLCKSMRRIDSAPERPFRLGWWLDVNFPQAQIGNPLFIATRVPFFVRRLMQSGNADLFLDATGEMSWFAPRWVEWMAALAQTLGCSSERIIYVPQNEGFADRYRRSGLYKKGGPRVAPLNAHLLLTGMHGEPEPFGAPSKKFLCFNQMPHLHRTALLLELRHDGIIPDMHLSFNQSPRKPGGDIMPLTGAMLEKWLGAAASDIERRLDEAEIFLPLRLDLSGAGPGAAGDGNYVKSFNAHLFADAAIYLVSETEMEDGAVRRFTEKTVKGLAAMIPFIVFGNVGTLAMLRDLGFKSFAPLIDESYDAIEYPVARFRRAYDEVRRLHAMPLAGLAAMRRGLHDVLRHNRAHLISIGPAILARMERELAP